MKSTFLLLPLLASACLTADDCDRRVRAAHRDAIRDADACRWEPDLIGNGDCGLDPLPRLTYYGVWCSRASLACIRGTPDTDLICFGDQTDTGVLPASARDRP